MKLRKGTTRKSINPSTGRILSIEGAKKKAWTAFARYIRARDPRCVLCGSETTEAAHFIHNTDKVNQKLGGNLLWYNETNLNGNCGKCNRWLSGNLAVYSLFLIETKGAQTIPLLYQLYRTPKKFTIPELLEIETKYKAKYLELARK